MILWFQICNLTFGYIKDAVDPIARVHQMFISCCLLLFIIALIFEFSVYFQIIDEQLNSTSPTFDLQDPIPTTSIP